VPDVVAGDVAEDPTEQEKVDKDDIEVGVGARRVSRDDLDLGRQVVGSSSRPVGKVGVLLDEQRLDVVGPWVIDEYVEEVTSVACAEAGDGVRSPRDRPPPRTNNPGPEPERERGSSPNG
jgi:hypothetical protein